MKSLILFTLPILLLPSLLFAQGFTQGSDGNAIPYLGILSGWTTSEGRDGRKIAHPGILSGWTTSEGRDGRKIAHPGILSGWTTSEGRDGRIIAHPGILSGWTTSEGRDGRIIAHPNNASVSQGNNGRMVAHYFYRDNSMRDVRQLIVEQIREEEGSNLDALWILKTMGHLDEDYASSNSSYSEGYQAGYSKGESDATSGALDTAFLLIDIRLQSHNLSLSTLEDDLNRTRSDFFREGYNAASEELISEIKSNPSVYNLVPKSSYDQVLSDANASAEQAIADAKASAKEEGVDLVKANPSTYGLYSSTDLNASIESALSDARSATAEAIANAKAEGIEEGETLGKSSVLSNPSAYNLVEKDAYDQMMSELMSASDSNATHYTEGWFYHPSRGWMWTNLSAYPYFYDATDKDWMYFQSGNDKPKFYRYKTKTWLTVD
jgi:hypothetical protein